MPTTAPTVPVRLLRRPEVCALTGLKRSALYQAVEDSRFPRPVKIGERAVAWIEEEVSCWVQARIAARDSNGGAQ